MNGTQRASNNAWKRWVGLLLVLLAIGGLVYLGYFFRKPDAWLEFFKKAPQRELLIGIGEIVLPLVVLFVGISLLLKSRKSESAISAAATKTDETDPVLVAKTKARPARKVNYSSCNVFHANADRTLWQFESRKGSFVLTREFSATNGSLPGSVLKTWSALWQPKLNIAWLPPENVFLRVVHLPQGSVEETYSMVELQLEKLSPIPVTQLVWSIHPLERLQDGMQSLIVVLAERKAVEEFLGTLEGQGFLADRLEMPALDQLLATPVKEDGAYIYPGTWSGPDHALVAWWSGGALQNINIISMPATGDRAASLKEQLAHTTWAGEMEGWLTTRPSWRLVADTATATQWETPLRQGLDEPIAISEPIPPGQLAALTAARVARPETKTSLLPPEFTKRYQQQFHDRLWMRGLLAVGALYIVGVLIYFAALSVLSYQTNNAVTRMKGLSGEYTNTLQIKARYDILKERQDLKFAALDCWRAIAETLPDTLTLDTMNFSDGRRLSLNGTAGKEDSDAVLKFYTDLRKYHKDGEPLFNLLTSDQPNIRGINPNSPLTWSFTLELKRTGTPSK